MMPDIDEAFKGYLSSDILRGKSLKYMTLEELISNAEEYGDVNLWSDRGSSNGGRGYYSKITFTTDSQIKLTASSEFGRPTMTASLVEAISKAEKVRSQFK